MSDIFKLTDKEIADGEFSPNDVLSWRNQLSQLQAENKWLQNEHVRVCSSESKLQAENARLTKDLKQKELIHIGYTNKYQVAYAKEEEGSFYPDSDNECYIPVYMLKVHSHRAVILEEALAAEEGEKDERI